MPARSTTTGRVLEEMILPALRRGGYDIRQQVDIGTRLSILGRHKIDVLASKEDATFLISAKWQQSSGTTDEKVPYEVICLADAIDRGSYRKAYLVLGGTGWKPRLKQFYLERGLDRFIGKADRVDILGLEEFVTRANQGNL
ncbi:MAG: PD-(D/E)XK nuclease superfamily protein [Candidatus Polarisedimenticolia bacterium]